MLKVAEIATNMTYIGIVILPFWILVFQLLESSVSKTTNFVVLMGYVGRDPELRAFPNSTPVANFTLATESSWKDQQDNWQSRTDWHRISAVGTNATLVESAVKKGTQLHIVGELRYSTWVDKKTGEERSAAEIRAHEIVIGRGGVEARKDDEPTPPPAKTPKAKSSETKGRKAIAQ